MLTIPTIGWVRCPTGRRGLRLVRFERSMTPVTSQILLAGRGYRTLV